MFDNPMDMYNPYLAATNVSRKPNDEEVRMDILEYNAVSPLPKDPTVTMAYVPFQTKSKLYSAEKALSKGTLFEVLDKPFLGGSAKT